MNDEDEEVSPEADEVVAAASPNKIETANSTASMPRQN